MFTKKVFTTELMQVNAVVGVAGQSLNRWYTLIAMAREI
jgi:hypothetical protein